MRSNERGFAVIAIVVILVLISGAIAGYFILQSQKTFQEKVKPETKRVTGNAKVTEDGIDTPIYEDETVGDDVYRDGAVIKKTLRNGVETYLVITPFDISATWAEIGEFSQMPTSSTHVPLYTDLGFGVNVAFLGAERGLSDPAYLVFDFSKGEVLERFKNLAPNAINRCDFSRTTFFPDACATLLRIPADQTMNTSYLAVSPTYADDDRTPTFPIYSYYLGTDDLLVLKIWKDVVIIPQPFTRELALDLVESTFQRYAVEDEGYEGMDLIRHLDLDITNEKVLFDVLFKKFSPVDFKTLHMAFHLEDLIARASNNQAGENDSIGPDDLDDLHEIQDSVINDVLDEFLVEATFNIEDDILYGTSQLRRAYDSRIAGSTAASIKALDEIMASLQEESVPSDEARYLIEGGLILIGDINYQTKQQAWIGSAIGSVLGARSQIPQDSDAERKKLNEKSEEMRKIAEAKGRENIENTLNNEDAAPFDLFEALEQAQLLGIADEYRDKIIAKLLGKTEGAIKDDEIIRALALCQIVSDGKFCTALEERANEVVERRCHYEVVMEKGLLDYGQNQLKLVCE